MRKYNYSNLIIYQVFYAIPFVFEIKIFLVYYFNYLGLEYNIDIFIFI